MERACSPPTLTRDMLLGKEWGSRVRDFAKKTGLGFVENSRLFFRDTHPPSLLLIPHLLGLAL
jgi:hypothetical protein